MKKNIVKTIALGLATILSVACLMGCGGNKNATMSKVFTGGTASYIDAVAWYASDVYTLKVNGDNTYELTYQEYIFGTTDPGSKGLRTVIYTGKCTATASADGELSHVDYKLEAPERIYFEQHEKGYGRSVIAGTLVLDTANWTANMTAVYDPEGNTKGAKEFLAEFGESLTITVEDPSKLPEDTTLAYKVIELPELALVTYAK